MILKKIINKIIRKKQDEEKLTDEDKCKQITFMFDLEQTDNPYKREWKGTVHQVERKIKYVFSPTYSLTYKYTQPIFIKYRDEEFLNNLIDTIENDVDKYFDVRDVKLDREGAGAFLSYEQIYRDKQLHQIIANTLLSKFNNIKIYAGA